MQAALATVFTIVHIIVKFLISTETTSKRIPNVNKKSSALYYCKTKYEKYPRMALWYVFIEKFSIF